jgi:hypothetical protein
MTISTYSSFFCEAAYTPPKGQGRSLLYAWSRVLVAAGWTAVQTSNGTTVITNDWGVTDLPANSWGRFRDPAGTVELMLECDTTDWGARAWISMADGFVTGAAPTTAPTATDQEQIVGTSGSFDTDGFIWKESGADAYVWTVVADSSPRDGNYYFHIIGRPVASPVLHRAIMFTERPALAPAPQPAAPGSARNRVWDTVAGRFVTWGTSADPMGRDYPGPGTFGQTTTDYCLVKRG